MAACSSGNSSPLVLRITHDELLAYAEGLDKKKERKHSKKKSHDKEKEKELKPGKQVDKKDSTDVSGRHSQKKTEREECETRKESKLEQQKSKDGTKKDAKQEKNSSESKLRRKSSTENKDNAVKDNGTRTVTNDNRRTSKSKDTGKRRVVSRKEVLFDNGKKASDDYELELRARTGGVLNYSNSKFPDEVLEKPPKGDIEKSQPRGIIKLPEGVDLNDTSEEKEFYNSDKTPKRRTQSESNSSRLYVPDNQHSPVEQRQEVQNSSRNESASHTNEMVDEDCVGGEKTMLDMQSGKGSVEFDGIDNTSMKCESPPTSHVKVEKKVKSLHLQKAQRLLKMVAQKETSLSNLLSREMLDKAAFEKINSISKEIQDAYKGIMMLDLAFAVQQEVDQNLWRNGFYKVIETLRKYGKLFLGYADKTEMLSPDEINNCLKEFLANAETFYKNILELLQKDHEFSVQDVVNQPRKAERLGKKVRYLMQVLGLQLLFNLFLLLAKNKLLKTFLIKQEK